MAWILLIAAALVDIAMAIARRADPWWQDRVDGSAGDPRRVTKE